MKSEFINLIIADDHPIVRQGIRRIIEAEADLKIVAEAADGSAALEQIIDLKPDVALLDLDMPVMNGLAVLQTVREREIPCKIIFLTVHDDEALFKNAVRSGAQGYVIKDSASEDIVKAIRAARAGQKYTSPSVTAYLFRQSDGAAAATGARLENLSPAERRILRLVADYQTSKQIAEALDISLLTVKSHRRNIAAKLGIEGSHALMRFALENKTEI